MDKNYAIMFADVAGSVNLYDSLGNTEAEKQIAWCVKELTNITFFHNGKVIKTIGDEIMASFENADDSINAAIDIQTNISNNSSNILKIRIGLQYGKAIAREGDLYGDAVNIAARMSGIAKGLQIITTESLVNQLNSDNKKKARLFDKTKVKGKNEELNIYQINWEEEANVTQFSTSHDMQKVRTSTQVIVLKFAGQEKLLTSEDLSSTISIGNDASCHIHVAAEYASRSHANLEFRRGKFILTDHSTNGTYVQFNGQTELFIRREEIILMGDGFFSLGKSIDPDSDTIFSFSVLQGN